MIAGLYITEKTKIYVWIYVWWLIKGNSISPNASVARNTLVWITQIWYYKLEIWSRNLAQNIYCTVHKIEDQTEQIVTGAGYLLLLQESHTWWQTALWHKPCGLKFLKIDIKYADMGTIEDHIFKLFNMIGVHLRSSYAFLTFILDHTGGQNIF